MVAYAHRRAASRGPEMGERRFRLGVCATPTDTASRNRMLRISPHSSLRCVAKPTILAQTPSRLSARDVSLYKRYNGALRICTLVSREAILLFFVRGALDHSGLPVATPDELRR